MRPESESGSICDLDMRFIVLGFIGLSTSFVLSSGSSLETSEEDGCFSMFRSSLEASESVSL